MISVAPTEIRPLEIWHGLVNGRALYSVRGPERAEMLFRFLSDLHAGTALTESLRDTEELKSVRGFQRVVICGGCVDELNDVRPRPLAFEISIAEKNPFTGWSGAKRIAAELGWSDFSAIDLGQSGMKLMSDHGYTYLPRDLDRFPLNRRCENGKADLRKWLNEALDTLSSQAGKLSALCLALPCKLEGFYAEPCSYLGLEGDVRELVSGLDVEKIAFVNDAVLAAMSDHHAPKTLVITLGHGVGAALWQK